MVSSMPAIHPPDFACRARREEPHTHQQRDEAHRRNLRHVRKSNRRHAQLAEHLEHVGDDEPERRDENTGICSATREHEQHERHAEERRAQSSSSSESRARGRAGAARPTAPRTRARARRPRMPAPTETSSSEADIRRRRGSCACRRSRLSELPACSYPNQNKNTKNATMNSATMRRCSSCGVSASRTVAPFRRAGADPSSNADARQVFVAEREVHDEAEHHSDRPPPRIRSASRKPASARARRRRSAREIRAEVDPHVEDREAAVATLDRLS